MQAFVPLPDENIEPKVLICQCRSSTANDFPSYAVYCAYNNDNKSAMPTVSWNTGDGRRCFDFKISRKSTRLLIFVCVIWKRVYWFATFTVLWKSTCKFYTAFRVTFENFSATLSLGFEENDELLWLCPLSSNGKLVRAFEICCLPFSETLFTQQFYIIGNFHFGFSVKSERQNTKTSSDRMFVAKKPFLSCSKFLAVVLTLFTSWYLILSMTVLSNELPVFWPHL